MAWLTKNVPLNFQRTWTIAKREAQSVTRTRKCQTKGMRRSASAWNARVEVDADAPETGRQTFMLLALWWWASQSCLCRMIFAWVVWTKCLLKLLFKCKLSWRRSQTWNKLKSMGQVSSQLLLGGGSLAWNFDFQPMKLGKTKLKNQSGMFAYRICECRRPAHSLLIFFMTKLTNLNETKIFSLMLALGIGMYREFWMSSSIRLMSTRRALARPIVVTLMASSLCPPKWETV